MVDTPFHIKIRIGEAEVELRGDHEEVLKTLQELDKIVKLFSEAFNVAIEEKKAKNKSKPDPTQYPKIPLKLNKSSL
ncbi:hypothetical protein ACFL0D_05635, partial [Thermoproteota archaeon]